MRVAIVGGTGPFGRALARRLQAAGDDVVLGSRDRARAVAAAAELGVEGAVNEESVRGVELVVLATNAAAMLETARALPLASPVLSVASELRSDESLSLAERLADVVAVPVVAGLHSLAAGKLSGEPPDEDAFVCGDDADAKGKALEVVQEHHAVLIARRKAGPSTEFLIRLRGDQRRFKNMWEFPTVATEAPALVC